MASDITHEDMTSIITPEDLQNWEQLCASLDWNDSSFEQTELDPLLPGAGDQIHELQMNGSEEDFVMVDDFGNPIGYIGLPSEPPGGAPGLELPVSASANTNAPMINANSSHRALVMSNDYCLSFLNSGISQTTHGNSDSTLLANFDDSNPPSTQSLSPTTNQVLFGDSPPPQNFDHFYSELPVMLKQEHAQTNGPPGRSQRQHSCSASKGLSLPTPATTVASPACQLALPQPAESSPAWSQMNEETPLLLQDFHAAMYQSPQGIKRPSSPEADISLPSNRIKKPKIHHPDYTKEGQDLQKRCESGQIEMTGLICKSKEEFTRMYQMTEGFYRKPLEFCTNPYNDPTFPSTDEHHRHYVHLLKNAIMSWRSFIEWRQTLNKNVKAAKTKLQVAMVEEHEAKKRQGLPQQNALTVRDLLPSDQDCGMYLQDVPQMHSHVLGRLCNDWCAESYSWQLLEAAVKAQQGIAMSMPWTTNDGHWEAYRSLEERVNMIAYVLRNSKQVLKSIMCMGNGWVQRVANNPYSELNGKVDNMRCNLKKNRNVKAAARQQREDTEG